MRSALFWDSMQQRLVVCYPQIPEKLTSHLHHSGSLKSHKTYHHKIFKVLRVGNAQKKKPHLTLSIKSEVPATLKHSYLGSFSFGGGGRGARILEIWIWVQSVTLLKGQGSLDSESSLRSTRGLLKRPKCIGTDKGWNPLPIHSFIHHGLLRVRRISNSSTPHCAKVTQDCKRLIHFRVQRAAKHILGNFKILQVLN